MICKLAHYSFFLLLLAAVTSCKSTAVSETPSSSVPGPASLSESDRAFISAFLKDLNLTHYVFGCQIYSPDGKKINWISGHLCWYQENGYLFVSNPHFASYQDQYQKPLWVKTPSHLHHTLKKSQFRDEFLALNSEYLTTKAIPSVRYDELVVISAQGHISKSFKFSKYDIKKPLPRPPADDDWSCEKEFKSKEFTHGNSFNELWTEKNGLKKHTGYVYYSNVEEIIYLFDPTLTKMTAKINAKGFRLHSVQQYTDSQLIAYRNSAGTSGPGGIYLIDKKTYHFQEMYKFTDKRQGSNACSSVQPLPGNRLFIVHSRCDDKESKMTFLEFVDLNTGKSVIQGLELSHQPISGMLMNLTGFLSNNYSQ